MHWWITDGVLERAETAPAEYSILTNLKGTGNEVIPEGVRRIENEAFRDCSDLTGITLPQSLTDIGDAAFYWCKNLTDVVMSDGVESVGNEAFYWCRALERVKLSNNLKRIGRGAFTSCYGLKSISLPDGLTEIGGDAFHLCEELTGLVLPDSVTHVEDGAFSGCRKLQEIEVLPGNRLFHAENGMLISADGVLIWGAESLEKAVVPDGVWRIADEAFFRCVNLTAVEWPGSMREIGKKAFYRCENLKDMTLLNGLEIIEDEAFDRCIELRSIDLPDSLRKIGHRVFRYCASLKDITLPGRLQEIGSETFSGGLTSMTMPAELWTYENREKLGIEHKSMICCPVSAKKESHRTFAALCIGFAKNQEKYSKELCDDYIECIRERAEELIGDAIENSELLHLMCREKLISARWVVEFEDHFQQLSDYIGVQALDYKSSSRFEILRKYQETELDKKEIEAVRWAKKKFETAFGEYSSVL